MNTLQWIQVIYTIAKILIAFTPKVVRAFVDIRDAIRSGKSNDQKREEVVAKIRQREKVSENEARTINEVGNVVRRTLGDRRFEQLLD